ncbi:glycoside hydrolase family 9 protein [Lutibacter holmesii]|uniref:Glycoside hydrolase family 9 protein n=1 Tax=Lutibacter holmesii TaxID=1137985 RepID=A0ABW3WRP2_9FLAO
MKSTILINHTGYNTQGIKTIVLQTTSEKAPKQFNILNTNNNVVYTGNFLTGGNIDNWHTGKAYAGDFSKLINPGVYFITTEIEGQTIKSREFNISEENLSDKSLSLLIEGIESQHCTDEFDEKDKKMTFFGDRKDTIDVSGGWYDASGDRGKYLSHLCYSNYFNPQQTPLIVWNLLEAINQYQLNNNTINKNLKERMLQEAIFGADFLIRMQDAEGYFYTNVFANWSWEPSKREICAYEGQDGEKTDEYKAGFREGGGIAIAALARAAVESNGGSFSSEVYLNAAIKGFAHLVENNTKYIDDGKENIIDDYCALLAATELYGATKNESYIAYAQNRAKLLTSRIKSDDNYKGWWSANDDGSRPFFHGVESGLPLISLKRYLDFEEDENLRAKTIQTIQKSIDFEIEITNSVHNPFGYPRQYVKATNEEKAKASFFIPHHNETGYWWQGENSRLASLVSAFNMTSKYMTENQKAATLKFSSNCNNWILGLNPYDICMVDGLGFNNPDYKEGVSLNFKGGVCNGITSGFTNENDIAFMPLPQDNDPSHKWRWSEQWMPHSAWFLLAVTSSN